MFSSRFIFLIGAVALFPVQGIFLQPNQDGSSMLRSACTIKNITGNIGTRPLLCAFLNFGTTASNNTVVAAAAPTRFACVNYEDQTSTSSYACTDGDECATAYSSLGPDATIRPTFDCDTTSSRCVGYFMCDPNLVNGVTTYICPTELTDNAVANGITPTCIPLGISTPTT